MSLSLFITNKYKTSLYHMLFIIVLVNILEFTWFIINFVFIFKQISKVILLQLELYI